MSPHLLKVKAAYSSSFQLDFSEESVRNKAYELWGQRPIHILARDNMKDATWCHMIVANGPPLKGGKYSELVIIWWSKLEPDTNRVLSIVDWEKYSEDFKG